MRRLDRWLIGRVKISLDFFFDWFGITQKLVERSLIVLLGFSVFIETASRLLNAPETRTYTYRWYDKIAGVVMIIMLWRLHKMPTAERVAREQTVFSVLWRFSGNVLSLLSIVIFILENPLTLFSFSVDIQVWLITIFLYVIATDTIEGERKSAKLAWSKIKELFGTAWIPQPKGIS